MFMGYGRARKMHGMAQMGTCAHILVMLAALTTSCVLPIPASPEDEDAGLSGGPSYPVIVDTNPAMPGPRTFNMSSPFPVSITFADANIGDTLYIRVFRDYTEDQTRGPIVESTQANDPVTGSEERPPKVLDTASWCLDAPLNENVIFEIVVADRPFDPNPAVAPPFQAVMDGGRSTKGYWVARCVESI